MYEDVKEFLSRYYYLSLKVDSLKEELRCLELLADGTQGINYDEPRVQKSPSLKAPFVRNLNKLEKKIKQIDELFEEVLTLKDEIQEAIATVDDAVMELVLTYRYVNCWDWNEVADKLGYAESYVYELHRKALQKVQIKRT